MFKRILSYFATLSLIVVMLFACGGGGGGGDSGFSPPAGQEPPPTGELPITADNATDITSEVIDSLTSVFDIVDVTSLLGVPLPELTERGLNLRPDWPLGEIHAISMKGTATTRTMIVDTVACDMGVITTTWDDADDNLELSTGDTLEGAFTDCFLADLEITLSGSAFITNVMLTGDVENFIPPYTLAANLALIDITGTDAEETVTINSNFDLFINATDLLAVDIEVSGSEVSAVEEGGSSGSLTNFAIGEFFDLVTGSATITAMGTLTTNELNGSVYFETTESFVILAGDEFPSSGELTIEHDSSGLVATVIDNANVELAIDADGDGTAESTLVVSWLILDAS